ncbi:MAG: TetR/AcrR family transcriptional regulator [Acidobacteria bacterium]|nr:TetR/AcrR family transcriptional regulator [Acidobacteriota bacterium]
MTESAARVDTKQRILDTAERLFAEQGLAATSLREIIGQAQVNLAAIHYHFGSKEDLIEAVVLRRVEPVNRERLAMLDACEAAAADRALPIEGVIEAFIVPTLRVATDPARGGRPFVRLMGRLHTESTDLIALLFQKHFGVVIRRFAAAAVRAVPEAPREEIFWRMYFAVGAMAHTLVCTEEIKAISGGLCDTSDMDGMARRMIRFLAAGFRS